MISANKKRYINLLIKVVIFGLLTWAIYEQVFVKDDIDITAYFDLFKEQVRYENLYLLLGVFLLMLVNWGLEAVKWQSLIRKIESLSLYTSFKAILCGVTLAVFTPNRIGEYGGRVFYLKKGDRLKGVAITLISSYGQLVVTVIMGILGYVVFSLIFLELDLYLQYTIHFLVLLVIVLLLLMYFNIKLIYGLVRLFPFLHKIDKYVKMFSIYSFRELSYILSISLIRYIVYSVQFLLLLNIFGIHFAVVKGAAIIALIFLVQTIIPTVAIVELGVRGNVALYFVNYISDNPFGILSATFSLWLINLIIPAIIGAFLILRINFLSNNNT